jgi:hypothetical protein
MERADVSDDKPIVGLCAGVGVIHRWTQIDGIGAVGQRRSLAGRLSAGLDGKFAEAGARRRKNR